MSDEHQPKQHVLPVEGWPNVLADLRDEVRDGDTILVRTEAQRQAVLSSFAGRDINVVRHRFERFQAGNLDNRRAVAEQLYRRLTGKDPSTD